MREASRRMASLFSAVAAAVLPFSSPCGAATNDQAVAAVQVDTVLPPLLVTATRQARAVEDIPYFATVLDATDLLITRPARTVPEALKYEPGIMIQKTGHGQASPYIRGFTGYRTLFLVDGIRLNNSTFRDGPNQYWTTVDHLGLSRMEIARGPFSVLYGSDAVGGTVHAISRGASDMRPGSDWDRRAYYRYSSAEDSHISSIDSLARIHPQAVLGAGVSFKQYGDLRGGRDVGRQPQTGYDELNWHARLEYTPEPDSKIVLAHQNVDIEDAWRTHTTIYGTDWKGLVPGNELRRTFDQERQLTYLQLSRHNLPGFVREINAGISHQYQAETRDRLRSGNRHDRQGFDVNTFGGFIALQSPVPFGSLLYGAEYYHDRVSSFSHTMNADGSVATRAIQGPVGDDAEYDLLGIYLQNQTGLGEQWELIIGARGEYAAASAGNVADPQTDGSMRVSDNWSGFAGSARIRHYHNAERSLVSYAGVSQGFRAPNLSDITRFDSARSNEIETPSPDLTPEKYITSEAGLKISNQRLRAQAAYFYTLIDDMIIRTPTGRIVDGAYEVTKRNSGDGYVHGIELDARWQVLRELAAFGVFTWMDGRLETYPASDAPMVREYHDRLMPPTGRFGLRWDNRRYWIEGACNLAARADKLSSRDAADISRIPPGGTPGYAVYELRAGFSPYEGLQLSAAVENITNEDYRIHGSGVNEAGRNFIVAVNAVF